MIGNAMMAAIRIQQKQMHIVAMLYSPPSIVAKTPNIVAFILIMIVRLRGIGSQLSALSLSLLEVMMLSSFRVWPHLMIPLPYLSLIHI